MLGRRRSLTGSIKIAGLRNIKSLAFDLPPSGIWLLTAGNGAGKTSLLACLRRIGDSNAFPFHFPSSAESENLDNFGGSSVTYSIGGQDVEYVYGGTRWVPRPRKNSHLLRQFGYPSVIYIGADAKRLTPRPEDFAPRNTRAAPTHLIEALNSIFETEKFTQLKTISLRAGPGNRAFLLKVSDNPIRYHSEKHFSLGELCVINLVEKISGCPNQSLILIDELEIALHPRAQVQLFNYLSEQARLKRLTIVFSTHSVSLLKKAPHQKIIYLDKKQDGSIDVVIGCFPTYAIGNITLGEETTPDIVLYVEDEVARLILEPLVKLALQSRFQADAMFPDVKVIPIGGFDAVVRFLTQHSFLLRSKAYALLDNDVKTETVANWQANGKHQELADFDVLGDKLDYLPWTPEVAVVQRMRSQRDAVQARLVTLVGNRSIAIRRDSFNEITTQQGSALRDISKVFNAISKEISEATGREILDIKSLICLDFAQNEFSTDNNGIRNFLLRKLN